VVAAVAAVQKLHPPDSRLLSDGARQNGLGSPGFLARPQCFLSVSTVGVSEDLLIRRSSTKSSPAATVPPRPIPAAILAY